MTADIARATQLLQQARYAVALTGAGLSTPSGIPDFRSPQSGLWAGTDPLEVASLQTFRYTPERFFEWVRPLAALLYAAAPNAAHRALARLEALGRVRTVLTQNIDRLHTRAGSRDVVELHGSLDHATCVVCFAAFPCETAMQAFIEAGTLPRCPDCGGLLKPNVTLMGEELPAQAWRRARQAASACDVMLVAGSSLEVMPVAGLPLEALSQGADVIVINRQPTYVDEHAAVVIHDDVAGVLPTLADAVEAGP